MLSDFGLSRTIVFTRTNKITPSGTPIFASPEVFQDNVKENLGIKSDVFSYGLVMYTLLTGKYPFDDIQPICIYTISQHLLNGGRFDLPSTVPSYFRQLITLTWDEDPNERPDFSDIIDLFDAGIILPEILKNQNGKETYYKYTNTVSNIGSFDPKNLKQLKNRFKKDNKEKLAAVITFFFADYFDDPEAQAEIGRFSFSGVVLPLNNKIGFQYTKRAAEKNNAEALFYLGQAYENGIVVDPNIKEAYKWYNKASKLGYQTATNYILTQNEYKNVDKSNAPTAIIIGSSGSGKTTFLNKLVNINNSSETLATIGANYVYIPCVDENNDKFYIRMCDTQGMEKFGPLLPNFFRDVNLALVMFDFNNSQSFNDIDEWIRQLNDINQNAKLIIIGNKIDLPRVITKQQLRVKASDYHADYFEISALEGLCIEPAVETIKKFLCSLWKHTTEIVNHINIAENQVENKKSGCC